MNSTSNDDVPTTQIYVVEREVVSYTEPPAEDYEPTRYQQIADTITVEDFVLTALAVYHESRGEPIEGQQAVTEVIFNRVLHSDFPNSVREVIFAPRQFACASYLTTAGITEPDKLVQAFDVVDYVLKGDGYITEENDVFFATSPANGKNHYQIGNHYFSSK